MVEPEFSLDVRDEVVWVIFWRSTEPSEKTEDHTISFDTRHSGKHQKVRPRESRTLTVHGIRPSFLQVFLVFLEILGTKHICVDQNRTGLGYSFDLQNSTPRRRLLSVTEGIGSSACTST